MNLPISNRKTITKMHRIRIMDSKIKTEFQRISNVSFKVKIMAYSFPRGIEGIHFIEMPMNARCVGLSVWLSVCLSKRVCSVHVCIHILPAPNMSLKSPSVLCTLSLSLFSFSLAGAPSRSLSHRHIRLAKLPHTIFQAWETHQRDQQYIERAYLSAIKQATAEPKEKITFFFSIYCYDSFSIYFNVVSCSCVWNPLSKVDLKKNQN